MKLKDFLQCGSPRRYSLNRRNLRAELRLSSALHLKKGGPGLAKQLRTFPEGSQSLLRCNQSLLFLPHPDTMACTPGQPVSAHAQQNLLYSICRLYQHWSQRLDLGSDDLPDPPTWVRTSPSSSFISILELAAPICTAAALPPDLLGLQVRHEAKHPHIRLTHHVLTAITHLAALLEAVARIRGQW